jgi:DNA polymerase I
VPLLKDKFAAERKKAKTVNFSIAYGKTARGFAADWNCTLKEAEEVIAKWFSDRPEVKDWQQKMQKIARQKKYTQTLLGRYRRLDRFVDSKERKAEGMWMRRAINTPIQGGAADIVIAAMIKIARNARLKELGWKLLMQIHDELILEGPEESSAEAFLLVKENMEHPF